MIAINQLVDIKLRLLRSPEEQNRKRLISTQWLAPHPGVLLLLASGCDFFVSFFISLYQRTSFTDYLSLLKSPCHRSAGVALGLSVKFLCLAVVCG